MNRPNINMRLTDLGITHKIDGHVIDITDTAMQAQTRRALERKYEDTRFVTGAKILLRAHATPEEVWDWLEHVISRSRYNNVASA